jgi:hypothetical protein
MHRKMISTYFIGFDFEMLFHLLRLVEIIDMVSSNYQINFL